MTEFNQAAWRRGQAQAMAADRRLAQKKAALDKKSAGGGGRGRSQNSGGWRASGRATRGQGSWSKAGKVPALLLKIHAGGQYGDRYSERQKGAQFIDSNMLGRDGKERACEFEMDAGRHPRVNPNNLFVHLSLSRPAGEDLTPPMWRAITRRFLQQIGADDCQFVCTKHNNTQNPHIHIVFSRARVGGGLVSMSQNRWKWREAVRQVETELGITAAPRPVDANRQVAATSDTQVNASRRAQRRGTPSAHIDPSVISQVLALASTPDQFAAVLEAAGIQVKAAEKNGKTMGILFQKQGAQEWLAGSSISREFSLPKVQARIELNRQASLTQDRDLVMQRQREAIERQRQAQAQQIQHPRERY